MNAWTFRKTVNHRKPRTNKSPTLAERAVEEWLLANGFTVIPQPCRLFPLPDIGTYTPDFLAWKPEAEGVMVVEAKGGYKGPGADQGEERYRRAAAHYDSRQWHFVRIETDRKRMTFNVEVWGEEAPTE